MDSRRNVRASLRVQVTLRGLDRAGLPFEVKGESVDFSRKGLGLLVDKNIVAADSMVCLSVPGRFQSGAIVQWTRPDPATGQSRLGLRLINPKVSTPLRLAASLLLCFALLAQISPARSRRIVRAVPRSSCVMSLADMKSAIAETLSQYALVSDTDKAFVHILHQHMTCEQYTRAYEESDFYPDPRTRTAIANWHWTVYHATDEAVRAEAVRRAEEVLNAPQQDQAPLAPSFKTQTSGRLR
jgi:hypothetical protein